MCTKSQLAALKRCPKCGADNLHAQLIEHQIPHKYFNVPMQMFKLRCSKCAYETVPSSDSGHVIAIWQAQNPAPQIKNEIPDLAWKKKDDGIGYALDNDFYVSVEVLPVSNFPHSLWRYSILYPGAEPDTGHVDESEPYNTLELCQRGALSAVYENMRRFCAMLDYTLGLDQQLTR